MVCVWIIASSHSLCFPFTLGSNKYWSLTVLTKYCWGYIVVSSKVFIFQQWAHYRYTRAITKLASIYMWILINIILSSKGSANRSLFSDSFIILWTVTICGTLEMQLLIRERGRLAHSFSQSSGGLSTTFGTCSTIYKYMIFYFDFEATLQWKSYLDERHSSPARVKAFSDYITWISKLCARVFFVW